MQFEPVPGEPVGVADTGRSRILVIADYHAGLERSLRREGVELESRGETRSDRTMALVDRTGVDELLFLGDLATSIGAPRYGEADELEKLLRMLAARLPVTITKGNHDGEIESLVDEISMAHPVTVVDGPGVRIGSVGFAHGHTWPAPEVLAAETICIAHEHPVVRLEDEVGGARVERVWLRGQAAAEPFAQQLEAPNLEVAADLVVCPGFNELSGGTWVNVDGDDFLCPFLPDGLLDGEAYLLDGTRLGDYQRL